MTTLAERIVYFNQNLKYDGPALKGFSVLNPFLNNPETPAVMRQFYEKFYNDNHPRKFILGINPSRHGAGVTGVPFTDTKRLESVCGIPMHSAHTHEISSVFMYDMIEAYGGAESFYSEFYINSPFPLAIVRETKGGNFVNANYYDDKALFESLQPFMIKTIKQHVSLGLDSSEVYILGKKNAEYISKINQKEKLFGKLTVLDHPRYIQQYKSKEKDFYINKYLNHLLNNTF